MNRQTKPGGSQSRKDAEYVFQLYITGASPNSMRAISNTRNICEQYFSKKYELEIIDVYQQPMIARQQNIIALPLLIRRFPLPERRLIGDMSDAARVLRGIGHVTEEK